MRRLRFAVRVSRCLPRGVGVGCVCPFPFACRPPSCLGLLAWWRRVVPRSAALWSRRSWRLSLAIRLSPRSPVSLGGAIAVGSSGASVCLPRLAACVSACAVIWGRCPAVGRLASLPLSGRYSIAAVVCSCSCLLTVFIRSASRVGGVIGSSPVLALCPIVSSFRPALPRRLTERDLRRRAA